MPDSPARCQPQPTGRCAATGKVRSPEASAEASTGAGGAGAGGGGPRGRAARIRVLTRRAAGFSAAGGGKAVPVAGPGAAGEDKAMVAEAAVVAVDGEEGEYEQRRRARIAENQRMLEALGLSSF